MTTTTTRSITLTAEARYGYGGKQYIAQITGRSPKFTFERQFVGKKMGKRGEGTEAMIDEPGLYETRDVDNKGRADDTYYLYDGERKTTISKEAAMALARRLDEGATIEWRREVSSEDIAWLRHQIDESSTKDPQGIVELARTLGTLGPGPHVRATVSEERRRLIAEMERDLVSPTGPTRDSDIAAVRALMSELGVTLADLQRG